MKKTFLLIFIISTFISGAFADAYLTISNDINANTTWRGTIYISAEIRVYADLTIEAGTVIKFAKGTSLLMQPGNNFIADGVANPIIFTSKDDDQYGLTIYDSDGMPEAGDWISLHVGENHSGKTFLKNVEVYYAGEYSSSYSIYALTLGNDSCIMEDCIVKNSDAGGIKIYGTGAYVSIYESHVTDCRSKGLEIESNTVREIEIDKCRFYNNGGHGLDVFTNTTDTVKVKISNCNINYNGYGISISGNEFAKYQIANCNITHNSKEAIFMRGISCIGPYPDITVEDNGTNAIRLINVTSSDSAELYNNCGIPYAIDYQFNVGDIKLNIYKGTIIKLIDDGITIGKDGYLNIYGTENEPVIFTNIADDTHGGDTNYDGATTSPTVEEAIRCYGEGYISHCRFLYSKVIFESGNHEVAINNSSFENSSNGGSALLGKVDMDSCSFINNSNIAFSSSYDTCRVSNCLFNSNYKGILSEVPTIVRNTTFSENTYGVYNRAAYLDLGKNSTDSIGNNIFTNNVEYDIYNGSSYKVYAIKNIWDGTTAQEIDNKIYDDDEKSTRGEVIFDPWFIATSIDKMKDGNSNISIYPNPVIDLLNIENKDNTPMIITVFDITGNMLETASSSDATISINMNKYSKGIYFIAISYGENRISYKIIKK